MTKLGPTTGDMALTELSKTYVSNSYVNSTDFGRVHLYRTAPHMCVLILNIDITASLPTNTEVTIGRLPVTVPYPHIIVVAGQSSTARVMYYVDNDGKLNIMNYSGTSASGWFRTVIPLAVN